jgi:hypothetical protein
MSAQAQYAVARVPAAASASSRWNARSCRATGGCARLGWRVAKVASLARTRCAAPMWKDREATRLRCHHDRSRRHDHHQDPDGGRLWGAGEVSLSFEK